LEWSRRGIEYTGLAVREERDGADEDPRHEAQLRALGHLLEAVEDLDLVREGEPGERGQERAARRGGVHVDGQAVEQRGDAARRGQRRPLGGADEAIEKLDERRGGPRRDAARAFRALPLRLPVGVRPTRRRAGAAHQVVACSSPHAISAATAAPATIPTTMRATWAPEVASGTRASTGSTSALRRVMRASSTPDSGTSTSRGPAAR